MTILPLLIGFAAIAGCSSYPIPDNATLIKTEEIVRYARCEMRAAIVDQVLEKKVVPALATEGDVVSFVKKAVDKEKDGKKLSRPEDDMMKYMNVAVAYDFDFDITEENQADGGAAFKLPLTSSVLDVGSSASLHLKRQGRRVFKAQNQWSGLVIRAERCTDFPSWGKNPVYPLGGSIGVGRVVATYMDLIDQGGVKESFVDTLIFTTDVDAGANASIKINPVPHSFRLVSASLAFGASRLDIHKMTISLTAPRPKSPKAITGVERYDGDLNAPFDRPAPWRARYNLCVADAREREDSFKVLRQTAPEIYCIQYADAFSPQDGPPQPVAQSAPRAARDSGLPRAAAGSLPGAVPQERRRPNFY